LCDEGGAHTPCPLLGGRKKLEEQPGTGEKGKKEKYFSDKGYVAQTSLDLSILLTQWQVLGSQVCVTTPVGKSLWHTTAPCLVVQCWG
jgi:hypothetical protein